MKQSIFKNCNPLSEAALLAYKSHTMANPNGAMLHNGKSVKKSYGFDGGLFTVYETKTQIVVVAL